MFNGNNIPSLSDIAAVTKNSDNGWGDGNGWWILIILFALFGWGGNGWGNNGGGMNSTAAAYTDSALQRGSTRSRLSASWTASTTDCVTVSMP